ncbi:MAG: ABC transporter permease subunit [Gemmatimonadota bacterium]|nr:ABC transporter permease subunit [Gemmatimonadota bacterium]
MTSPPDRGRARTRALIAQGLALGGTAAVLWWLGHNAATALDERGITIGFGFLRQPANFEIGETWLRYGPEDTIGRAIAVGLVNTVVVSAFGCLLSLVLGFALGFMRLSSNPPLRGMVRGYVELVRNVPLLLLLLFLVASMHGFPSPGAALHPIAGVFLSNRGLAVPAPAVGALQLIVAAIAIVVFVARRRLGRFGDIAWIVTLVTLVATILFAHWDAPRLRGRDFAGGRTVSPEFAALLFALVLHHAANVSEVVRGAIQSVSAGQTDAARALGLSRAQAMRFVILPLALRAMVPLLASNAVSLIKNSSLGVAIGFPDVVSILNTTGNQTGHAIETMLIMIAVYLSLSLSVGAALDRYNRRLLVSERRAA